MFGQQPFGSPFGVPFPPARRRWFRRRQQGFGPFGFESPWARRRRHAQRAYRAGRWTARKGWTHRRGLAPVYATAGLAALGAVGQLNGPAAMALWVWVTVVLGVRVAKRLRRKAYRRAQWAYIAATYLAATFWLTSAVLAGPVVPVRAGLVLWLAAAGAPWWFHHRVRPHVYGEVSVDDRIADWDEHIAAALPGATLSDIADILDPQASTVDIGWRGRIEVPKGRTIRPVLAANEQIAGVYDAEIADVEVEATGARTGTLTVYTENPLRKVRHWPGAQVFSAATGVATIGSYADGVPAPYRFYHRHNGPVHDLIAGTTGAGKSALLNSLLAIERAHPFMASVVIDPQRGQSLPDWKNSCALFGRSVEEGVEVLLAVRDEMYRRNELLANVRWKDDRGRWREGVDHFDPLTGPAADLGLPLICLTIEESHAFKGTVTAERVIEDIAKMARKCGIKLRVVAQVPLLDQLPGSTTLRDMLVGGNVISFRTANKLTAQVSFNGAEMGDPSLLPRDWPDGSSTSGLCYILGPTVRSAKARTYLVEDPFGCATTGETTELPEVARSIAARRPTRTQSQAGPDAVSPAAGKPPIADRAIAWLDAHETGIATTGSIAKALDEELSSVSTALARAAKTGRVRDLGRKMWGRLEPVTEEAEDLAAAGAA